MMNPTLTVPAAHTPGNRVYSDAELVALNRAAVDNRRQQRDQARAQLAAGVSPFRVHRDKILGFHSTALRLQAVVLNLYNSAAWNKKAPVHLGSLLANADAEHIEVLVDLLRSYAIFVENDPDFMALGRHLAEARQPKPRRAKAHA